MSRKNWLPSGAQLLPKETSLSIKIWMEVSWRHRVQLDYKQEQREVKKKLQEIEVLKKLGDCLGGLAV